MISVTKYQVKMTSADLKLLELESCCVCGQRDAELKLVETLDAELPVGETTLRAKLAAIADDKIAASYICPACIQRANDAWSFQRQLRASQSQPSLSDKIKLLRQRLRELTQKVDVFVVIGPEKDSDFEYSDDNNIIMVDKNTLGNEDELESIISKDGVKIYQCTMCPKMCEQASEMLQHQRVHPPEATHICRACGRQFSSRQLYKNHSRVHKALDGVVCKLCGTIFQDESEMQSHTCRLQCPSCQESFPHRAALSAHVRAAHHAAGAAPHVCDVCFNTFDTPDELREHAGAHASKETCRCAVQGCGLTFSSIVSLLQHSRSVHGRKPSRSDVAPSSDVHKCTICNAACESAAALRNHLRSHDSKPKRGRPKKIKLETILELEVPIEAGSAHGTNTKCIELGEELEQIQYEEQPTVYLQEGLEGEYELQCVEGEEVPAQILEEQVEYLEVETLDEDLEEESAELII